MARTRDWQPRRTYEGYRYCDETPPFSREEYWELLRLGISNCCDLGHQYGNEAQAKAYREMKQILDAKANLYILWTTKFIK